MFIKLEESSDNVMGFRVTGFIKRKDYRAIDSEMDRLLEEYENIKLLLQFDNFLWEFMTAWGKDAGFGMKYGAKIDKLAIVGERKWQEAMAKLSAPIFGKESKFFHAENIDSAWEWLKK